MEIRLLMKNLSLLLACLFVVSCASTYYGALEQFGIEKRDILVDRVDEARDAQEEAKEQFTSALEQYRSVINVDAGDLEKTYDRLKSEYERSVKRANEVKQRVKSVESVSEDLFDEWDREIDTYSDPNLAKKSQRMMNDTRTEYTKMIKAMQRAEQSMGPVLVLFNDQVLFLRHNLNARAIGALQNELTNIELATTELIREMEQSIKEANRFIDNMK